MEQRVGGIQRPQPGVGVQPYRFPRAVQQPDRTTLRAGERLPEDRNHRREPGARCHQQERPVRRGAIMDHRTTRRQYIEPVAGTQVVDQPAADASSGNSPNVKFEVAVAARQAGDGITTRVTVRTDDADMLPGQRVDGPIGRQANTANVLGEHERLDHGQRSDRWVRFELVDPEGLLRDAATRQKEALTNEIGFQSLLRLGRHATVARAHQAGVA